MKLGENRWPPISTEKKIFQAISSEATVRISSYTIQKLWINCDGTGELARLLEKRFVYLKIYRKE